MPNPDKARNKFGAPMFEPEFFRRSLLLWGRGTARSSNQVPNNTTQTKQKAHKQD